MNGGLGELCMRKLYPMTSAHTIRTTYYRSNAGWFAYCTWHWLCAHVEFRVSTNVDHECAIIRSVTTVK